MWRESGCGSGRGRCLSFFELCECCWLGAGKGVKCGCPGMKGSRRRESGARGRGRTALRKSLDGRVFIELYSDYLPPAPMSYRRAQNLVLVASASLSNPFTTHASPRLPHSF